MEENVNAALGLEPFATPEYPVESQNTPETQSGISAEKILINIANIILILGIIGTIICLFTLCFIEAPKPGYTYRTEMTFNPAGFATTIMVLFSTIISWSVMKVLANISLTLKKIEDKMK